MLDEEVWRGTLAKLANLESRLRAVEGQQKDMDAQLDDLLTRVEQAENRLTDLDSITS